MPIIISQDKQGTRLPDILRAALRLFVSRGIDGTTIKDIAREAGVAEGALYRHYKSKEEMAKQLFAENLEHVTGKLLEVLRNVKGGARAELRAWIVGVFAEYESDPELFYFLMIAEHKELAAYVQKKRHVGHLLEDVILKGQREGVFAPGPMFHLFASSFGAVHRACVLRRYGIIKQPLTGLAAEFDALVWKALRA